MSNSRKSTKSVRVTLHGYALLKAEADSRGIAMSELIEELLPQHPTGPCRYCRRTVRQPLLRHRYHAATCHLYADKDFRQTPAS